MRLKLEELGAEAERVQLEAEPELGAEAKHVQLEAEPKLEELECDKVRPELGEIVDEAEHVRFEAEPERVELEACGVSRRD